MNLDHLHTLLRDCTKQLRKGDVVTESGGNFGMKVTTIDNMPHADAPENDGLEKIDMELVVIGVDKTKAEQRRAELIDLLNHYPEPERLAGGPSYIEVGGVIGDQGAAFQLFALGQVLGLWKVITPASMGITGPEAKALAGTGMVMITGYRRPE